MVNEDRIPARDMETVGDARTGLVHHVSEQEVTEVHRTGAGQMR